MLNKAIFTVIVLLMASLSSAEPVLTGKIGMEKPPLSVVVDSKRGRILAATTDSIEVIDGKSREVAMSVPLTTRIDPNAGGNVLTLNSKNGRLYYPGDGRTSVVVLDAGTFRRIKAISGKRGRQSYSWAVAVNEKTNVFLTVDWAGYVSVHDAGNNALKGEFPTERGGGKLFAVSPSGERLYISYGDEMLIMDIKEKKVLKRDGSIKGDTALFVDRVTGKVYVAGRDYLYMVNEKNEVSSARLRSPASVRSSMAMNPKTGNLFVPSEEGTVMVFKVTADDMVFINAVEVGQNPRSVAVDDVTGTVYVATEEGISVIEDR